MALSPENEQFLDQSVSLGLFASRDQAIDEGLQMLRQREQLRKELAATRKEFDANDCEVFDQEGLRSYFDMLKQRALTNADRSDAQ